MVDRGRLSHWVLAGLDGPLDSNYKSIKVAEESLQLTSKGAASLLSGTVVHTEPKDTEGVDDKGSGRDLRPGDLDIELAVFDGQQLCARTGHGGGEGDETRPTIEEGERRDRGERSNEPTKVERTVVGDEPFQR